MPIALALLQRSGVVGLKPTSPKLTATSTKLKTTHLKLRRAGVGLLQTGTSVAQLCKLPQRRIATSGGLPVANRRGVGWNSRLALSALGGGKFLWLRQKRLQAEKQLLAFGIFEFASVTQLHRQ